MLFAPSCATEQEIWDRFALNATFAEITTTLADSMKITIESGINPCGVELVSMLSPDPGNHTACSCEVLEELSPAGV